MMSSPSTSSTIPQQMEVSENRATPSHHRVITHFHGIFHYTPTSYWETSMMSMVPMCRCVDVPRCSDQLFSAAFHHDVAFSQRLKVEARIIGSSWEQRITKDLLRCVFCGVLRLNHRFEKSDPTHSRTIRVADSLVYCNCQMIHIHSVHSSSPP